MQTQVSKDACLKVAQLPVSSQGIHTADFHFWILTHVILSPRYRKPRLQAAISSVCRATRCHSRVTCPLSSQPPRQAGASETPPQTQRAWRPQAGAARRGRYLQTAILKK